MKNQLVWGFPNEQSVTSGEISGSDQYVERTFTKADILTLGTAKVILPATPNGTYYDVTKAVIEFKPSGGDYVGAKDYLKLSNGIYSGNIIDSILESKAASAGIMINKNPGDDTASYGYVQAPLTLIDMGGNPTDPGGAAKGTLKVKVWYQIRQII